MIAMVGLLLLWPIHSLKWHTPDSIVWGQSDTILAEKAKIAKSQKTGRQKSLFFYSV